jgi:hypothetical protein
MILRLINLFLLLAISVGAQSITNVIPLSRLPAGGTFQGVAGVKGGIDQYSTNYSMFCNVKVSIPGTTNIAYGDGVHDDTAALNFAVNAATNGSYVYVPTGTYLISSPISRSGTYNYDLVQHPFSIIIRGDGPTNTVILNNGNGNAIALSYALGFGQWGSVTNSARGSTNIGIFSGSGMPVVNQWILIDRPNSVANVYLPPPNSTPPFYYVYDTATGGGSDDQMVRITSVSGHAYSIDPPLNEGYGTNDAVWGCYSPPIRCGIENLGVVQLQENNVHNIRLIGGCECWVRNVESRQARGYHISLEFCGGCEVRECYVHNPFPNLDGADAGGGSDYGITLGFHSSSCLVEDNVALHCRHSFIMETGAGQDNVIAYNYGHDNLNEGLFETDFQEDTDYHGGEQRYCLWEGNVVPIIRADTTEGATKYVVYFRNYVRRDGLPTVLSNSGAAVNAVVIERGNYYDYILNNVYAATAAVGSPPVYVLGGNCDAPTAFDPAVITNSVWIGNYDFTTGLVDQSTNGVIYWTNSEAAAFPSSLLYVSKPSWFGTNVWPPIGGDLSIKTSLIPAQTRAQGMSDFTNIISDGYTLAVSTRNGSVVIPGNGSYFNSAMIALSAVPNSNHVFSNWSGYPMANSSSAFTYLTMPAGNIAVTANFISNIVQAVYPPFNLQAKPPSGN